MGEFIPFEEIIREFDGKPLMAYTSNPELKASIILFARSADVAKNQGASWSNLKAEETFTLTE